MTSHLILPSDAIANQILKEEPTPPPPLTIEDEQCLMQFFQGLKSSTYAEPLTNGRASPSTSSSTSTSSTLVESSTSEEDDSIFDKPQTDVDTDLPESIAAVLNYILSSPDEILGSPEAKQLNPQAAPFTPRFIQTSGIVEPPPNLDSYKKWHDLALKRMQPSSRDALAFCAASSTKCTHRYLDALALEFMRSALDPRVEVNMLVLWTEAMVKSLKEMYGQGAEDVFLYCIRERAVTTFKALWSADSPSSISYEHAPSAYHVNSAWSLTCYLGDLYSHRWMPAPQISECIGLLLGLLTSHEHLHAIELLITRAGPVLFSQHGSTRVDPGLVNGFLDALLPNASRLTRHASILGRSLKQGEVEQRVEGLVKLVRGLVRARASAASEVSPSVLTYSQAVRGARVKGVSTVHASRL